MLNLLKKLEEEVQVLNEETKSKEEVIEKTTDVEVIVEDDAAVPVVEKVMEEVSII